MDTTAFVKRFEDILTEMIVTMKAKNNDYARGGDPFKNLRRHEEYGIVVRLDDKIARLDSFFNPKNSRTLAVKNESIVDTAKDTANYAVLLIMLHEELEAQRGNSPLVEISEKEDPFHDEGNATNHRLSQCDDRCKEDFYRPEVPPNPVAPPTTSVFLPSVFAVPAIPDGTGSPYDTGDLPDPDITKTNDSTCECSHPWSEHDSNVGCLHKTSMNSNYGYCDCVQKYGPPKQAKKPIGDEEISF